MKLKLAWSVLAEIFSKWNEHKAIRMGAALAYFGIFAIAPVLMIAIAIAGLVYGRAATEGNIVRSISGVVGSGTALFVQELVESASQPRAGVIAAMVGVVGSFLARPVFSSSSKTHSIQCGKLLRNQATDLWICFGTMHYPLSWSSGSGFFCWLSAAHRLAWCNAVGSLLGSFLPGGETIWQLADFGLSFGLVTLLFAGIFKILPDVHIPWRDVWPGAVLTALLFTVAQVALSVIIRLVNPGLAFGAAGALVVILMWVDLASLILLFGAEFIRVYSMRFGSRAKPKAYAEALTAEAKAEQGQGIPAKEPVHDHCRGAIQVRGHFASSR